MRMVPKYFTDGKRAPENTVLQTPDDFVVIRRTDSRSNTIWIDPKIPHYSVDEVIHDLNHSERHIYEIMREVASQNLLPDEGEWKGSSYDLPHTRRSLEEMFRATARTYTLRSDVSSAVLTSGVWVVNFVDFIELVRSLKPEQGSHIAKTVRPLSDFVQTIPFVR